MGKRKRPATEEPEEEELPPPLPNQPLPTLDDQPPLPDEPVGDDGPPLPDEPVPSSFSDDSDETSSSEQSILDSAKQELEPEPDAWQAIWAPSANAYYFYNTETKEST